MDGRRIAIAEQGRPDLPEPIDADHLVVELGDRPDGHRSELLLDDRQVTLLRFPELREVRPGTCWQDAVRDHQVARVAEQVEVGERPPRLGDGQLVEGERDPDRGLIRIAQESMNVGQPVEQPLGRGEDLVTRDRDAEDPLEHRPAQPADPPADRRDALDPPATRVR